MQRRRLSDSLEGILTRSITNDGGLPLRPSPLHEHASQRKDPINRVPPPSVVHRNNTSNDDDCKITAHSQTAEAFARRMVEIRNTNQQQIVPKLQWRKFPGSDLKSVGVSPQFG